MGESMRRSWKDFEEEAEEEYELPRERQIRPNQSKRKSKRKRGRRGKLKPEVKTEIIARDILKRGRWVILLSVLRDSTRVVDIARVSGLPRSTISRILGKLIDYGLVEAYRGIDGRCIYYKLSGEGEKVVREIRDIILKKLSKCIREETIQGGLRSYKVLDPKCAMETLKKINSELKVITALLSIAGVTRRGDKLVIEGSYRW